MQTREYVEGKAGYFTCITIPEMMHVWIVDSPGRPSAEGVDKEWALGYHREHGVSL